MSEVAAIGAGVQIGVLALAGVRIYPAETEDEVRATWNALPAAVAVVVLTGPASRIVAAVAEHPDSRLTVVMPPWPG